MAKSAPLVLGLALPLAYVICLATDLPGHVTRILGGDTLEVLHPERVRLSGAQKKGPAPLSRTGPERSERDLP